MTDVHTENDSLIGQLIANRYKVGELLGQGGMSKVFLAFDNNAFDCRVALKSLLIDDPQILERFNAEAMGQTQLSQHPHICGVRDTITEDGKLKYIIMDYIPGESLQSFMSRNVDDFHKPSTQGIVIQTLIEVCEALHYAHNIRIPGRNQIGIIHRDVKPDNIMLQNLDDGKLSSSLVDLGICQIAGGVGHTCNSGVLATPIYGSPEQILTPANVDHRTDIFPIGMILYWLFAKEKFYDIAKELSIGGIVQFFETHREARLDLISHPIAKAITAKALAFEPNERYSSAYKLAEALKNLRQHLPTTGTVQIEKSQSPTLHYGKMPREKPGNIGVTKATVAGNPKSLTEDSWNEVIPLKKPAKSSKAALAVTGLLVLGLIGGLLAIFLKGENKPTKKMASSEKKTPTMLVVTKAVKATGLDAKSLFDKWDTECKATDKMRGLFKTTHAYHSLCIRYKKARPYIKQTHSFKKGAQIVKLLRIRFCKGKNLNRNAGLLEECQKIANMLIEIGEWEKLHTCQNALIGLLKKGDASDKALPWKCKKIRWHLKPEPKIAAYCQRLHKRKGMQSLSAKCKSVFQTYPALIPK